MSEKVVDQPPKVLQKSPSSTLFHCKILLIKWLTRQYTSGGTPHEEGQRLIVNVKIMKSNTKYFSSIKN